MNICKLFSKITENKTDSLFTEIIGYNDVKRLVRMALDSDEQSHILLSGPPASAKTMFLESSMKLKKWKKLKLALHLSYIYAILENRICLEAMYLSHR